MSNVPTEATNPPEQNLPSIRWLLRRDLPEILDIEQRSFERPWSESDFHRHLQQRNCIGNVAVIDDKTVAYSICELERDHYRIVNMAVHPDYRRQGIGTQILRRFENRLRPDYRTHVVALVPQTCLAVQSFFERDNISNFVKVRTTDEKGKVAFLCILSPLTTKDVKEAQEIEDRVLSEHGCQPRNISEMLANGSRYGIAARDKYSNALMGYVLYERDSKGIALNGEFGVIVGNDYRKRGVGRKLIKELVDQHLLITFYDVCLTCKNQVGFLRAVGVPVPKPTRFVIVEWNPELVRS